MRSTGKFISLILRHKPEAVGITLDKHGWADVHALIDGINATGRHPTSDNLPRTLFLCEAYLPTDHPFDDQRLQSLRRVHRAGHWLALCKNPRLSHRGYDIFTTVMRILS